MIEFTSERRDTIFGWARNCRVAGVDYAVSVKRGKSVRIPYHKKRGWHWHASVYRTGDNAGFVWTGRVPKSLGVHGILVDAGVLSAQDA